MSTGGSAASSLASAERIGPPMPLARRVRLVQRGLRHDNGPLRMPLARRPDGLQHRVLLRVERLHDGDHQMRLRLVEGDVLGWVVAFFAKPARIEKADDGRFGGKVEDRGRPGAGLVAQPDLGRARLGERADDGGLARLHLADEPDHGRRLARERGHLLVRWAQRPRAKAQLRGCSPSFASSAPSIVPRQSMTAIAVSAFRVSLARVQAKHPTNGNLSSEPSLGKTVRRSWRRTFFSSNRCGAQRAPLR